MRILNAKTEGVLQGVVSRTMALVPHLVEVTYTDHNGTPHTVFAHKDGPFSSPDQIAQAHQDGTLHDQPHEVEQPDTPAPPAGPVVP